MAIELRTDVLGVVLAGGRSSRMGSDKGSIAFDGVPMARLVERLFLNLGLDYVVSVNAGQVSDYSGLFAPEQLIVDQATEVGGPLRGILSVHHARPGSDLLVVACDMPLLRRSVPERLLARQDELASRDFIAFDSDGIQPLCALYAARALRALAAQVRSGELPPFCPRKLMAAGNTLLLEPATADEALQFANVNRPEELAAARAQVPDLPGH